MTARRWHLSSRDKDAKGSVWGKNLADNYEEARQVFKGSRRSSQVPLFQSYAFFGPEEELTLTRNAQPGIVATICRCLLLSWDQRELSRHSKASQCRRVFCGWWPGRRALLGEKKRCEACEYPWSAHGESLSPLGQVEHGRCFGIG